jgi:hypothetical protein
MDSRGLEAVHRLDGTCLVNGPKGNFFEKKAVIWGCRYFWVLGMTLFFLYRVFINSFIKFLWVLEGCVLHTGFCISRALNHKLSPSMWGSIQVSRLYNCFIVSPCVESANIMALCGLTSTLSWKTLKILSSFLLLSLIIRLQQLCCQARNVCPWIS